jgi:hypothetical protein
VCLTSHEPTAHPIFADREVLSPCRPLQFSLPPNYRQSGAATPSPEVRAGGRAGGAERDRTGGESRGDSGETGCTSLILADGRALGPRQCLPTGDAGKTRIWGGRQILRARERHPMR